MSDPHMAQIQKRHPNIPQDALFALPTNLGGGEPVVTRTQKSIKWAFCPHHVPGGKKLTGLITLDQHTLVFRDHTKTVGKHTIPCPGSGQIFEGTPNDQPT